MVNNRVEEVSAKYLVDQHPFERRADIGSGEANLVPVGYKQTEAGVIPEDWGIMSFGDLYLEPSRNGVYKTSNFHGRGTRIVNMGEMFAFEFISNQEMNRVFLTQREIAVNSLIDGDLIFGRRSVVPSGAGKCSLVVSPNESVVFESSIIRVRLVISSNPKFYYYLFSSPLGRSLVSNIISGTNVKGIRASELKLLRVPSLHIREQTAIANALSDVDALISNLESLIAKKHAIKTATMQQLLTGRTRLPQFALWEDGSPKGYKQSELGEVPEDWGVFRFDQNFLIYAGGDVPKNSLSEIKTESCPYPIFANAIQDKGLYGYTGCKRSKSDSVTITARGYLGHAEYRAEPFFPIVRLLVLEPVGNLDSRFTAYTINELVEFPAESTGVPQLTAPQVGKFAIAAPVDKGEQTAIATILSDMDQEIRTLEQRLNKTRQIKQGMMQQLLTGKIRLVKPEARTKTYAS